MNKLVLSRFFGRGGLLMKKHSPQGITIPRD